MPPPEGGGNPPPSLRKQRWPGPLGLAVTTIPASPASHGSLVPSRMAAGTQARPHHVKDGVIQPGDGRASATLRTTVDRVTDAGPGSETEEQDAGGGACSRFQQTTQGRDEGYREQSREHSRSPLCPQHDAHAGFITWRLHPRLQPRKASSEAARTSGAGLLTQVPHGQGSNDDLALGGRMQRPPRKDRLTALPAPERVSALLCPPSPVMQPAPPARPPGPGGQSVHAPATLAPGPLTGRAGAPHQVLRSCHHVSSDATLTSRPEQPQVTSVPSGPGTLRGRFRPAPLTGTQAAPEDGSTFGKDEGPPGKSSQTIAPGPDHRDAQGSERASEQVTERQISLIRKSAYALKGPDIFLFIL
ncbi:unnamed protein product [Rangifer tarandus platyrhynchus]|uniref:Uncharacterized protein n=2 Tax=Rangifer tarandus platyrhynchus TaxID=3082113 RepID=A0ACB0F5V9_RANTA|nr:unnamed protein product [Rangifer tarandus platyrhynchus]CAI9708330.1 unnamed protein product [Rangifer tarandus platyrhynchus]